MKINFKEIHTKSNYLSLFRLLLAIPIYFILDNFKYGYEFRIIAFSLMILAAVTDVLDGYLARKFNEITELGKIIDPLADKIAIGIIVIKLFLIGEISEFYFMVILLRDVIIFVGGIIISKKIGKVLPSNILGKVTVLSIGMVLLLAVLGMQNKSLVYDIFYYASILLSFISLFGYALRGVESIRWNKNETI